jgi:DeoR/GlpR family transcriptional regulator of sugar metabolism
MIIDQRRKEVLSQLLRDGYVRAVALAACFDVSVATIRRDLLALEDEGLLLRTRGGAVPVSTSTAREPPWSFRRTQMLEAKRLIGSAAAALVKPRDTLILDAGSTTWQIADHLRPADELTIVSNDLQILVRLSALAPACTVSSTGGLVRSPIYTLYGPETERYLSALKVNWTFLGIDGIDLEYGLTSTNFLTISVKQAMIRAGKRVVVVADHTKFNQIVLAQVCGLDKIDFIITDSGLDEETANLFLETGVEVRRVPLV